MVRQMKCKQLQVTVYVIHSCAAQGLLRGFRSKQQTDTLHKLIVDILTLAVCFPCVDGWLVFW